MVVGYMFRYIYPLNRRDSNMETKHTNWSRNYPKDVDLQWMDVTDKKEKKVIDPDFTYVANTTKISMHTRNVQP